MTKTVKNVLSLIGGVSLMITAGVIGFVIGDYCGLDFELLMDILLVYLPPIVGSVCTTVVVVANRESGKEVMISNKTEEV